MTHPLLRAVLIALSLFPVWLSAQEKSAGPVIAEFGEVFEVPGATLPTNTAQPFKAVFDVMHSPDDKTQRNPFLESAARFLNMHARAGVPPRQLHAVLVVHNQASPDLLSDEYYRERFGHDNPNSGLLKALLNAGVEVVLCGQSSYSRDIPIEQTVPGIKLALSAMTALIQYQDQGYRLIKY